MEKRRDALVPSARSLLESVQEPRKQAHVVGKRWVNKPGGLLAEDLLLEVTMEEGVGDVHLMHRSSTGDRKVENRAYRAGLDNQSEGVGEVDASRLSEATNDPARFIAIKGTIRTELVFKDPLSGNHVGVPGTGNKLPRPVAQQGVKLLLHRSHLERVTKSGSNGGRQRRRLRGGRRMGVARTRVKNARTGAGGRTGHGRRGRRGGRGHRGSRGGGERQWGCRGRGKVVAAAAEARIKT